MKKLFFLLFLFSLTSSLWGSVGQLAWLNSNIKERIWLLNEYKAFFSSLEQSQGHHYDELSTPIKTSFFQIFDVAWAAPNPDCIYAGWPSLRINGLCSSPLRNSPRYEKGSCSINQLQCQPLLFGKDLCVPVKTKEQRQMAFSNCQKKFTSTNKHLEEVIHEIKKDKKENELFELMTFAEQTCTEGAQSKTPMCKRLIEAMTRMKSFVPRRLPSSVLEVDKLPAAVEEPTQKVDLRNLPSMLDAVKLAQKSIEEIPKSQGTADCSPEEKGFLFDRDEPRPLDLDYLVSKSVNVWENNFLVEKNGVERPNGFRLKNRGPNEIAGTPLDPELEVQREWNFVTEDGSRRETYLWITDDAGSGQLSQLMESVILLVPRKMKPQIIEVNDELHVTLTTGEKVVYDKQTRKLKSGVIHEGPVDLNPNRFKRKFANVDYQGTGISIRVNKRGEDPRLISGNALITQDGKSCQVPVKDLWNHKADFRYADDKELLKYLNGKCKNKFSL